jgi:uncharacterized protein (TIGR00297 family)
MQILIGGLLGGIVAYLAYRAKALNRSGAVAAALIGGLVFGLGGLSWAILLLLFFITSSLLSRAFDRRKSSLSEKYAKGSRRDYAQVLANGGLGAFLAIFQAVFPEQNWPWMAYIGAMAAVTADTWATEVGVLSPSLPVLITNGKTVEMGASGGVTLAGYLASLTGALAIGLGASLSLPLKGVWEVWLVAVVGGLIGATTDSLLGATVQGIYHCPRCEKETESHPVHRCGTPTTRLRGWRWLNNDLVNFFSSVSGAGVALLAWILSG